MKTEENIFLDFTGRQGLVQVNAKQGDEKSRFIRVALKDKGEVYVPPQGAGAHFRCVKPDGRSCFNPAVINEDGTVTVELTAQVLAVPGLVWADLSFVGEEEQVLSTANFAIHVAGIPQGQDVPSSNEFLTLVGMVARGEAVIQTLEDGETGLNALTLRVADLEQGGGSGGVSSWNDLTDKPFGQVPVQATLIDGTYKYLYSSENDAWAQESLIPITSDVHLEEGKTYKVSFDGVEYELECGVFQGLCYVGSPAAFGLVENEVPFTILEDVDGAMFGAPGFDFTLINNPDPAEATELECAIRLSFDGEATQKIDPIYLHQPDWEELDESSGSYVKNKPFQAIPAGTVILEETEADCSTELDPGEYCAYLPALGLGNFAYQVELDGQTYTYTAETEEWGDVRLGVLAEGFLLYDSPQMAMAMLTVPTAGTHTIRITLAEEAVSRLDAKFLPELATLPDVTGEDNDKILQVVDGVWTVVAVGDSAVKTYVDEYISSALEGDY